MHIATKDLPTSIQGALAGVGYGRKDIRVETRESIDLQGVSGDGFRCFATLVDLDRGNYSTTWGSWGGANPWNPSNAVDLDSTDYAIPSNYAVIKGRTGGGRPVYATIYIHPDNVIAALTNQSTALTRDQQLAIDIIASIKGGYRGQYFGRHGLGPYSADNPAIQELAGLGLLKINRAGSIRITTEGKNARSNRSI